MRNVGSVVMALALALVLSAPTLAQDEEVTQPFKLTLYGDVPDGEAFYVSFAPEGHPEGTYEIICGTVEGVATEVSGSGPVCEGNADGNVYTGSEVFPESLFPVGTDLRFSFSRVTASGEREIVREGTTPINPDRSIDAWFGFGGAGPDDDKDDTGQSGQGNDTQQGGTGQMPDELPDTGAGGAAGGIPFALSALLSLALAAYAVIRGR